MPNKKAASPNKFVESAATTPQARFLYMGAFQMQRRGAELANSPNRAQRPSASKGSYHK
jgi:hypothetical protein